MKRIAIFLVSVLFAVQVNAQVGVGINETGAEPAASAILDVSSTTKGFLPPVMTETERDAIASPAAGLQIYNSTTNEPNYFNGGEWKSMVGAAAPAVIVDGDGNVYTSVVIGTQEWLVEDLKTTKYNDGTEIPFVAHDGTWANLPTHACTFYDKEEPLGEQDNTDYGYLYNWYVVDAANPKNVCPDGWHVPTDTEWTTLTEELSTDAGGKLKETGNTHWTADANGGATNSSGFSALSGGGRSFNAGTFSDVGSGGYWWSATEGSSSSAWFRALSYDDAQVNRASYSKSFGFSVRCLRN